MALLSSETRSASSRPMRHRSGWGWANWRQYCTLAGEKARTTQYDREQVETMIRRHEPGAIWLIHQGAHAFLAAQIAAHWSGLETDPLREELILVAAVHD